VAAGVLRWLGDTVYGFIVGMMLLGSVFGTFQWVIEHSRRHRPRTPQWLGYLYFWLWLGWAGISAQQLVPQLFNLSSVLDLYGGRDFAWLVPALIWLGCAIALPAALLFAGRWTLARVQRMQEEREKAQPWTTFKPIGYRLNWERILSVPAVAIYDGKREEPVTTTVGKILNEILPGRFNVPGEPKGEKAPIPETEQGFGSVKFKTPDGRLLEVESFGVRDTESARFAIQLVERVLQLLRLVEGTPYTDPWLFFYKRRLWHFRTSSGEDYEFFVLAGDAIVLDDFRLARHDGEYFDHNVLKSLDEKEDWQKEDEEQYWSSDAPTSEDTGLRWWYRRFYTETMAGRREVFWNEPLFHYVPPERERDARLRRIEWAVLGIAGLLVAHYFFKWF
jgi:hypothetical protein